MSTDPYPAFSHLTLSQLGELFGVSAISVGRSLKELGLRTASGEPTATASEGEFVKRIDPGGGGRPFWVWEKRKCLDLLETAGRKRIGPSGSHEQHGHLIGPFTSRRTDPEGDGFEIVNGDGMVGIWLRGEQPTQEIVKLLNLAHMKAGWFV